MNLRNLYLLNTIVSLGFALGFLLMSPFLLDFSAWITLRTPGRWDN